MQAYKPAQCYNRKMVARITYWSFLLFFLPIISYAALMSGDDAVSVSISPEYPGPGEQVMVTVSGRLLDIDSSTITWVVGGKKVLEGPAEKNYSFWTSKSGSASTLDVSILTSDASRYQKQIRITPSQIDLIWEAKTYTPPFYKGHSLASSESTITVVALPELKGSNGTKISASKLIYKWSKDGKNIGSASGLGKQSFTFTSAKLFNENQVTVAISSSDGSVSASRSITISISEPRIVLYPVPALLGTLYDRAFGSSFTLEGDEIGVRATPYYFSTETNGVAQISMTWALNGKTLPTEPEGNSLVTLRNGSAVGTARISVNALHPNKLLQNAQWSGSVNLGNSGAQF